MRHFSLCLLGAVLLLSHGKAAAQDPPVCEPPSANEYLLLVTSPTESMQSQLQQVLPAGATSTTCTYVDQVVVRIGGFSDAENANAWAQYVSDMGGFQTFVVRPAAPAPASAAVPAPATPAPTAAAPAPATAAPTAPAVPPASAPTPQPTQASSIAYRPRPLGEGYAVLVDYFNRPEVAAAVQQLLNRDIGLVSYGQRPYLLAIQTDSAASANEVLQQLSGRNFVALIVDSRRAVLLTETVQPQP